MLTKVFCSGSIKPEGIGRIKSRKKQLQKATSIVSKFGQLRHKQNILPEHKAKQGLSEKKG